MNGGMGGHESTTAVTVEWLTPRYIIDALGLFDLDPCAAVGQPWKTAATMLTAAEDGLAHEWSGRVWLNPPYGRQVPIWVSRLAKHGQGTALLFARTETRAFQDYVWPQASAMLFLARRVRFHRLNGNASRRGGGPGGGAPSVLIAYGAVDAARLRSSGLAGHWVNLTDSVRVAS